MKKTALKPLLGVAAAALMLSACAPTAGSAAVVDGESISEADVDKVVTACEDFGFEFGDTKVDRATLINELAWGRLAAKGALGDVTMPEDEIKQQLAQSSNIPEAALNDPECGQLVIQRTRAELALTETAQTEGPEAAEKALRFAKDAIELNPRYGRLVEQDGITVLAPGSLSKPAKQQQG